MIPFTCWPTVAFCQRMNSTNPKLFLEFAAWAWNNDPVFGPAVARAILRIERRYPRCRVFDHKIYVDSLTPFVHHGMLSVALCCSQARVSAQLRDWVCLWWVKTDGDHGFLCCIFRVDAMKTPQEYYDPTYIQSCQRPDQIYDFAKGGLTHRGADGAGNPSTFHNRGGAAVIADHLRKDSTCNVLLSSTYWHGGHTNLRQLPRSLQDWIPGANQLSRQTPRLAFEPSALMRYLTATDSSDSSATSDHITNWGEGTKRAIQQNKSRSNKR